MLYTGTFANKTGNTFKVTITTHGDSSTQVEIGTEESGIYFADDPMEMSTQESDSFDVLICKQLTLRLLCRDYQPHFFCNTCREAEILVKDSTYMDIFRGYIEPQAFSQGYNEYLDEVELTCIDNLAALQYVKYKNIGAAGVSYAEVKQHATQRTFLDIILEILKGVNGNNGLEGYVGILYDGSKAIDSSEDNRYAILEQLSISELLFLGDSEDDVWTQQDVLIELLKYLNLHMVQGPFFFQFIVFSWETLRSNAGEWTWWLLETSGDGFYIDFFTYPYSQLTLDMSRVADCDTTLTIEGTYNQLALTDSVTEVEEIVDSPLDDSLVTAGNFQKYMTELSTWGNGTSAYRGMRDLCLNGSTDYDAAWQVDWFCWPKTVTNWRMYGTDADGKRRDMYAMYPADGTHQQDLLNKGLTQGVGACVCALGKLERNNGNSDNSPVTSVSMSNYFIISLNGQGEHPTDSEILAACPVAEYTGNKSGGTFSPADDATTNYIVISGKMVLNPIMEMTATYGKLSLYDTWWNNKEWSSYPGWPYYKKTVPLRNDGDRRYYTRQYWKADRWNEEVTLDTETNAKDAHHTFYPYTSDGPQAYPYNYSAVGSSADTISKLGLVACMLIIGDKCVVEKRKGEMLGTDGIAGTGEGETTDYVWMTYKERSQCASDEEYYAQSFTIGVDPKIGDRILGNEFDIQKNAPYTKGITAEGTAIPIRMGDHVSGQVRFMILGPVNAVWNNITYREPSFWRHSKWGEESVALLTQASSIMIKEFKVKVISDNGKIGAVTDEQDIVYTSDTNPTFVNRKDDLEMKITTALTSDECKQLGVNNAVKLSSPQNTVTQSPLTTIYDYNTGVTAKPEQLYVDAYWQEWHEPRILLTQNLRDKNGDGVWSILLAGFLYTQYYHPSLDKAFIIQGGTYNFADDTCQFTLKEIF